jgi:uncharacterized protein (DUF1778 family)
VEVMLPRLLDNSFAEVLRLHPTSASLTDNIDPLSTAKIVLPEGEPTIGVRRWIELFAGDKSLGIYRVASVSTDYGNSQTINLEHAATSLGDYLSPEETELTGTPTAILTKILSYQIAKRWTIGTAPTSGNYKLTVDRSNLLSAVLDLVALVDGYRLSFDFSTTPWKLSIVQNPATYTSECRITRNALNVQITTDDSEMCTRVYHKQLPNGYKDAANITTWGTIGKELDVSEDAKAADVLAYATKYLDMYSTPKVSINITARDLSERTGESVDAFKLGDVCRVALPDWGVVVDQRIVSINYEDLTNDYESVTITLSTTAPDLSNALAAIRTNLYGTSSTTSRRGGGGGGSPGKGTLQKFNTAIIRNTDDIQLKAWSSDVDVLTGRVQTAEAQIVVQADEISLKVSKNGVISAINQTAETIKIQASRIELDGQTIATYLQGSSIDVNELDADEIWCGSNIHIAADTVSAPSIHASSDLSIGDDPVTTASVSVVTGVTVGKTGAAQWAYKNTSGGTSYLGSASAMVINVEPVKSTIKYLKWGT